MKRIIIAFLMTLFVTPFLSGAPVRVTPTIKNKRPVTSTSPLLPIVPPIEITYDPDTRVLEVTGDNDWLEYVFLIDEFGNWFHDSDWLPYTYTIPSDHSGIWIIRIFGVDSDDWEIYAKIYV